MSMRYLIMKEQLIHYKYTNSTERIPHTTPNAEKNNYLLYKTSEEIKQSKKRG